MGAIPRIQSLPKQPPHSIEAEQSVLGGLLLNNDLHADLAGKLSAEDFYRADHQLLYRGVGELIGANKPCDFVTLTEYLRHQGRIDDAGGPAYIASLAVDTYSIANVLAYGEIVRERALLRRLIGLGSEIGDMGYRPEGRSAGELIGQAERMLLGLAERGQGVGRARTFAQVASDADASIARAAQLRAAGGLVGVPTGLRCVDERTGGLCPSQLWVLAARPSIGKSALLNQIGIHAARAGHPGLIISLEMSSEQIGIRAMAHTARVNVTKLRLGFQEERDRACESVADLGELPLYLDTDTYELSAICAQITHYRRKHGIRWAAVDHIGLVDVESYNSRNDQLGKITKELKRLSKTLDIGIIAVSQLNRNVEKDRRRPMLADLRDSGNIEQDAVTALFLHTDAEDSEKVIDVQFGLLKNRDGRRGWIDTVMEFEGATQTFKQTDRHFIHAPRVTPISAARRSGKDAAAGDASG